MKIVAITACFSIVAIAGMALFTGHPIEVTLTAGAITLALAAH